MSDTVNQRRSLPNLNAEEEISIRNAFTESDNNRSTGMPAIIEQALRVFNKKEQEARTRESFESIKTSKTIDQNERLAGALSDLQKNQAKSVDLLEDLLKVVKGQRENRQTLGFLDNLFTSLPFRNVLRAAGLFLVGASIAATMRVLLGDDEEIQQREDMSQQQRDELRRQSDTALTPREPSADELEPTITRIVNNAGSEQEAVERARILANSYGYATDSQEYQTIVNRVLESYRERIGDNSLPVPPIPPEETLPVPPIPPTEITKDEAARARVLNREGAVIPLTPQQSLPLRLSQTTPDVDASPLILASQQINDSDAVAFGSGYEDPDRSVEKIVEQREELAKRFENNPNLFSNRLLNIRARKITLKSDEIEFLSSDSIMNNNGATEGNAIQTSSVIGNLPRVLGSGNNESTGENGRLPDSELRPIGFGRHRLRSEAAEAYMQMVQAAAADGITWTVTDSYRTYEQQVQLAREKGLYSQGGLAAVPGRSNHGLGLAVDLGGGANREGTPQNRWLQENAGRFGFSTIPREPWHWEFRGGATMQQRPASQMQTAEAGGGMILTSPASEGGGIGAQIAAASQENAVAERTPTPPSITSVGGGETPSGPNPSVGPPNYFSSPNDPGNVEPIDAAERYSRLFNMAA